MAPSRKTDVLLGIIALGVWVIAAGELRQIVVPDAQAQSSKQSVLIYGCAAEKIGSCDPRPLTVDEFGKLRTVSDTHRANQ